MHELDAIFSKYLDERKEKGLFRSLKKMEGIDFLSNDYLGLGKRSLTLPTVVSGGSGSRLLSGNTAQAEELEKAIALFHGAEEGLLFPSGFSANIGLYSSIPREGELILLDSHVHASIRAGAQLSKARTLFWRHNDLKHLKSRLKSSNTRTYIGVEALYSMEGDTPPLKKLVALAKKYNAHLFVDEAHSTGIVGPQGQGLVVQEGVEEDVLARVHTFGKAIGAQGGIVVGSPLLRSFLINYAHSFIYTTALAPPLLATIQHAYSLLPTLEAERHQLQKLIQLFQNSNIPNLLPSSSPIQSILCPGNTNALNLAAGLQEKGFAVRAILSPTVRRGTERLRLCLHSFNTKEEVQQLIKSLSHQEVFV